MHSLLPSYKEESAQLESFLEEEIADKDKQIGELKTQLEQAQSTKSPSNTLSQPTSSDSSK